ncbi:MAG TPA: Type 1 glutamine amidotransferase-like domain-containing protein [Thermoanaerobaculia bacterium]|nr:Type 1 glutamine amidotransferase-like domain-containing protein [Thermoanaerobaculia bacterium]
MGELDAGKQETAHCARRRRILHGAGVLREAWAAGVVLAGVSAGAICWFEQGLTDSFDGDLRPLQCLGFLAGSCCPHFDGDAARRPTYHKFVRSGELLPGGCHR